MRVVAALALAATLALGCRHGRPSRQSVDDATAERIRRAEAGAHARIFDAECSDGAAMGRRCGFIAPMVFSSESLDEFATVVCNLPPATMDDACARQFSCDVVGPAAGAL